MVVAIVLIVGLVVTVVVAIYHAEAIILRLLILYGVPVSVGNLDCQTSEYVGRILDALDNNAVCVANSDDCCPENIGLVGYLFDDASKLVVHRYNSIAQNVDFDRFSTDESSIGVAVFGNLVAQDIDVGCCAKTLCRGVRAEHYG